MRVCRDVVCVCVASLTPHFVAPGTSTPLPGQLCPSNRAALPLSWGSSAPLPGQLCPSPRVALPLSPGSSAPLPGQLSPSPRAARPLSWGSSAPLPGQLCPSPRAALPLSPGSSAPLAGQLCPSPRSALPLSPGSSASLIPRSSGSDALILLDISKEAFRPPLRGGSPQWGDPGRDAHAVLTDSSSAQNVPRVVRTMVPRLGSDPSSQTH